MDWRGRLHELYDYLASNFKGGLERTLWGDRLTLPEGAVKELEVRLKRK
jgi:hypothetical protein